MAGERNLWNTMRTHMKPLGVVERVENSAGAGTPDVTYCLAGVSGWVELKALDDWPVRPATTISIPKLKKEQVEWLSRWHKAGGRAYMLLQVQRQYVLLDPMTTRDVYERTLVKEALLQRALLTHTGNFPTLRLAHLLTSQESRGA